MMLLIKWEKVISFITPIFQSVYVYYFIFYTLLGISSGLKSPDKALSEVFWWGL